MDMLVVLMEWRKGAKCIDEFRHVFGPPFWSPVKGLPEDFSERRWEVRERFQRLSACQLGDDRAQAVDIG